MDEIRPVHARPAPTQTVRGWPHADVRKTNVHVAFPVTVLVAQISSVGNSQHSARGNPPLSVAEGTQVGSRCQNVPAAGETKPRDVSSLHVTA